VAKFGDLSNLGAVLYKEKGSYLGPVLEQVQAELFYCKQALLF
jgi:hypothetical protein